MKTRQHNSFFQYAFIVCLGVVLMLGQAFKLHMHVKLQNGKPAGVTEQIGQVHIASTLHNNPIHSDSRFQNQNHDHLAEIEIGPDSYSKKVELLVLGTLLFLVGALLYGNFLARRVSKHTAYPTRLITPLLYFVNPPLRAPPAALRT